MNPGFALQQHIHTHTHSQKTPNEKPKPKPKYFLLINNNNMHKNKWQRLYNIIHLCIETYMKYKISKGRLKIKSNSH
jgi:hypothetical protein